MGPTIDRSSEPTLDMGGRLVKKISNFTLIKSICDTLKKLLLTNASICLLIGIILTSCSSYKQNIMFSLPEGYDVKQQVETAERNYIIQKNDLLELEVYTNKGERIIDPDLALAKDMSVQNKDVRTVPSYLVDISGTSKFPMIGEFKLEGLSIRQAEEMLQKAYSTFYQDAFVILKFINKRVIVLGAPGGQVIPLTNENVHLVEVLALAKGLGNDAKSQNIRVLRKDQVFVADLSTFEGYIKNNIAIEPGDIVYIEPIRRPFTESLRDYGPILSIVTSLTTLVVVIIGL